MNAHWHNGHKVWHREQKEKEKQLREGGLPERARLIAEAEARRAEATGDENDKRIAAALALMVEGDHNAAAKAWRKMIKEWPDTPELHWNLAIALQHSYRYVEAAQMYLKALELHDKGTEYWAASAAAAFDLLRLDVCRDEPKPEWWNDEALKALSARVVAASPDKSQPCAMRACAMEGDALEEAVWNAGPRTAAEVKEAAEWWRRAAMATLVPASKLDYEQYASKCDEYADPLLAKEEAEAAKARAAAETEAAKARAMAEAEVAEARKVAEAKAKAAAEELLAEEEEEKQQAASTKAGKTKQSKGKKGKGKR